MVRCGEIILKGLNRSTFENKLMANIRRSLSDLGKVKVEKSQARMYVIPSDKDYDFTEAVKRITMVFGVVSASIVYKCESEITLIASAATELALRAVKEKGYKTFKVESRRGNKKFPLESPEISAIIGSKILDLSDGLTVDVHMPEFVIYIEVREFTIIYNEIFKGQCGMPSGTNGKALLLLSGGIDSPVAGYMIGKRGVLIEAVHFYSYPFTSERSKDKVIELAKILTLYMGEINLYIVPFTDIQLEIVNKCPEENMTIIMRRFMMRIAEKIAVKNSLQALITGESIGQVASQTMYGLAATDAVTEIPVFRPLIGMDKNEIIEIAERIGTFKTSILPYDDCCTAFVAKHPRTRPQLSEIEKNEEVLDIEKMVEDAVNRVETLYIRGM
jgi:thiamine biosynthesis protein ThiI